MSTISEASPIKEAHLLRVVAILGREDDDDPEKLDRIAQVLRQNASNSGAKAHKSSGDGESSLDRAATGAAGHRIARLTDAAVPRGAGDAQPSTFPAVENKRLWWMGKRARLDQDAEKGFYSQYHS